MTGDAERLKSLYNTRILELANDIPLTERLADADATVSVRSPLCGSRITLDLTLRDGRVTAYGQTVRACTLGQAAASIMARNVLGATPDELRRAARALRAALKEGEPLPADTWPDLEVLAPARDYKSRHGSVMLAFDAVEKALDEMAAATQGAPQGRQE